MRQNALTLLGATACLSVTACTTVPASFDIISKDAIISKTTKTQLALRALAPPENKVTVAVYNFEDKTGQFRPTEAGQTLSRAVSQGGDEILIKALQDAGNRSWFTIIERSNLNNLLKERQIITEMRSRYLGETSVNASALPPLLFAGVIFEGGIVGFDTNTVTGGAAARYLGIGGQTDYRQNVVTVHLRAVSVKTGEVLASVTTEKTIASVGVAANAFRFVTFDNILEADVGITSNEPGLLALRQAVEKSVYALIMEGSEIGLWNFRNKTEGMAFLNEYKSERDGIKYPLQPRNSSYAKTLAPAAQQVASTAVSNQPTAAEIRAKEKAAKKAAKQLAQAKKAEETQKLAEAKSKKLAEAKQAAATEKAARQAAKELARANKLAAAEQAAEAKAKKMAETKKIAAAEKATRQAARDLARANKLAAAKQAAEAKAKRVAEAKMAAAAANARKVAAAKATSKPVTATNTKRSVVSAAPKYNVVIYKNDHDRALAELLQTLSEEEQKAAKRSKGRAP